MTLTGPDARILQIHPTRFCNLQCVHCYSSSGPLERSGLSTPLLTKSIQDAATLGYNVLSVSGGEPFLYPGLLEICEEAKDRGMLVTIVSNGTTLKRQDARHLQGLVNAMAISLDGSPERHNRIRRSARAFENMEQRLDIVREWGIPFSFVFTLTSENLCELEWAADFAVAQGATLLHIHPIDGNGRALSAAGMTPLSEQEAGIAWLAADCLRDIHKGKLEIHFDALAKHAMPFTSADVAKWKISPDRGTRQLSQIVSPLVIEDSGEVVPLRYGFPRTFALGNLHSDPLTAMAQPWIDSHSDALADLYMGVLNNFTNSGDQFGNMYQMLADQAGVRAPNSIPWLRHVRHNCRPYTS